MPVLVTCPSCATQLNIREEHAGRPVKCPKCSYVIPPQQAPQPPAPPVAAPPPLPTTAAAPPPLPSTPGSPPAERPTAKPASSRPRDRDEDDQEDRDRPKKRKPRRDDDDDDAPRRDRRPPKKSNTPMILGILGIGMLVCCGGGAFGIYYVVNKVKEKAKEVQEWAETVNLRVNRGSYERLEEGMTPGEVEAILGQGQAANEERTRTAFAEMNRARIADWGPLAKQGRVVVWRNGNDHIICSFYPNASNGRLQLKTWQPASGISAEQKFASDEEAAKPGWGQKKESLPAIEITSAKLASEYKQNAQAADRNYKGRILVVSGVVSDITLRGPDDVLLMLANPPAEAPGMKISCALKPEPARSAWRLSRTQAIKIRGRCDGTNGTFVNLADAKVEQPEADPSVQLQASPFFSELDKNATATEEKYAGKPVTLLSFKVVRRDGNNLILTNVFKSKWTVKAVFPADLKSQLDNVKVDARVTVKGEFSSVTDNEVTVNRCWLDK